MSTTARLADGTEVTLGPVGQTVVFENDVVRVWEITLEPGASVTWHHHENPYLVIALQGADNRIENVEGHVRQVSEKDGGVVYREPGETHRLINEGTTLYRSRLVELLQSGAGA